MNINIQSSTIRASDVKLKTGEVLRRVGVNGEHLIIERGQFPIAAIIPIADYKALRKDKEGTAQPLQNSTNADNQQ